MRERQPILMIGVCTSIILFVILLGIKLDAPSLLDINPAWIGVAIVPILLALILGKHVSKLSGFGIELEVASQKPISFNTSILYLLEPYYAQQKGGISLLNSLSNQDKLRINALRFQFKPNYSYDVEAIQQYLRELPNVQLFVIEDEKGKFKSVSLINRHFLLLNQGYTSINEFIRNIENQVNPTIFDTTSNYIFSKTSSINALKKIKQSGKQFNAVVNDNKEIIGIVFKNKLEEYLSTVLINAVDKTKL